MKNNTGNPHSPVAPYTDLLRRIYRAKERRDNIKFAALFATILALFWVAAITL